MGIKHNQGLNNGLNNFIMCGNFSGERGKRPCTLKAAKNKIQACGSTQFVFGGREGE
jgi:hypothetical protein